MTTRAAVRGIGQCVALEQNTVQVGGAALPPCVGELPAGMDAECGSPDRRKPSRPKPAGIGADVDQEGERKHRKGDDGMPAQHVRVGQPEADA
jgi:hypothetical protein